MHGRKWVLFAALISVAWYKHNIKTIQWYSSHHTHARAHTYTHARARTHTHSAHARAYRHEAHTRARTHTHTHTHAGSHVTCKSVTVIERMLFF